MVTSIITSTPDNTGINTYVLEVSDSLGCLAYDTANVLMGDPISNVFIPDSLFICSNTPVSGSVMSNPTGGFSPYQYNWSANPAFINLSNANQQNVNVMPSDTTAASSGMLTVSITDSLLCTGSDSIFVQIDHVEINSSPLHEVMCVGIANNITSSLQGVSGTFGIDWIDGDDLSATDVLNPIVAPLVTNTYSVVLTDSTTSCTDTSSFVINVNPAVADAGGPYVLCSSDTISMDASGSLGSVTFTVGDPHVYQWQRLGGDGGDIIVTDLNLQQARITGGTIGQQTIVSLTVTDSLGCTDSDTTTVDWTNYSVLQMRADTLLLCGTSSDSLIIDAVLGGTAPFVYNWSLLSGNTQILSPIDTSFLLVDFNAISDHDTSLITIDVQDSVGCDARDTVAVIGLDFQIDALTNASSICPGESAELSVQVLEGGTGNYAYSWTPVGAVDTATSANPSTTTLVSTTYVVDVTDLRSGCTFTDSVSVTVRDINAVIGNTTDSDSLTSCFGSPFNLSAANSSGGTPFGVGNSYRYTWTQLVGDAVPFGVADTNVSASISGGTPGTYSMIELRIEDAIGCNTSDTLVLFWNDSIAVSFVNDNYVCLGDFDTIQAQVSGGSPGYLLSWINNSAGAVNFNGPINQNDLVISGNSAASNALISLQVTDSRSCVLIENTSINVSELYAFISSSADSICPGTSITLTARDSLAVGGVAYDFGFGFQASNTIILSSFNDTTYHLTVYDSVSSCTAGDSINVTTSDLNAIIGNVADADTQGVCLGNNLNLTAINSNGGSTFPSGNPYKYSWTQVVGDASGLNGNDTNMTAVVSGGTIGTNSVIVLEITDGAGCVDYDTTVVFWNDSLSVSIATDNYACLSSNDTLRSTVSGGSPAYTYLWTVQGGSALNIVGANDTTEIVVRGTATPNTSTIVLAVSDAFGCSGSASVNLDVVELFAFVTSNIDTVCALADVMLTARDSLSLGGVAYDFGLGFQSSDTVILNTLLDTTFSVTILDSLTGCQASDSVDVVVHDLKALIGAITDPDTLGVCQGTSINLNALNSSGGAQFSAGTPYLYDWTQLSGDANGLTGNDTNVAVTLNNGTVGTYSLLELVVEDAIGCFGRDSVTIFWSAPMDVTLNSDQYACIGSVDSVSSTVLGGLAPFTYNWQILPGSQLLIQGATNTPDVAVTGTTFPDSGYVHLQVSDPFGCSDSDSILIRMSQLFVALNSNLDSTCSNSTVVLTASDSLASGTIAYDFGSGFQQSNTVNLSSLGDTLYQVVIIDSLTGCTASDSKDVKIIQLDVAIGGTDTTLCFEDSLFTLNAIVNGGIQPFTYQWSTSNPLEAPIADADTVLVNPAAQGIAVPTVYQLTVSDSAGCIGSTSFDEIRLLYRNYEFNITIGSDTSICANDLPLTLGANPIVSAFDGDNSNFSTTWSTSGGTLSSNTAFNPLFNTISADSVYTLHLVAADLDVPTCTKTDSINITVNAMPDVILADSTFWCNGEVLVLPDTTINYLPGTIFQWYRNDTLLVGENNASYTVNNEGIHVMVVTDNRLCSNSDSTLVISGSSPSVAINNTIAIFCADTTYHLAANISPLNSGTITWHHDGLGTIDDTTAASTTYTPDVADSQIKFYINYVTLCGSSSDSINVDVAPVPDAVINASDNQASLGQTISFSQNSSGNNLNYNWSIAYGVDSVVNFTGIGPHGVTYSENGIYDAVLTVTDSVAGCTDAETIQITVLGTNILFVPNVFSPNALHEDNQTLKVFGVNINADEFEFIVYNRWGGIVYESLSLSDMISFGWNGTYMGSGGVLEMGVYTYTLKASFIDGTVIDKVGSITMMK